jgi:N-acetyltransferase
MHNSSALEDAVAEVVARRRELWEGLSHPLEGASIVLEPLDESHRKELEAAASDARIWEMTLINLAEKSAFVRWWGRALAERELLEGAPFAIRHRITGELIGSTRYGTQLVEHRCVEIGGTWLHPDSWRTGTNSEIKLLMLARAFDDLGLARAEFKVAVANARSRASLRAAGVQEEGILRRRHLVRGQPHDSVYYSVVAAEWPQVRRLLQARV